MEWLMGVCDVEKKQANSPFLTKIATTARYESK
jgi:hypothetical protein